MRLCRCLTRREWQLRLDGVFERSVFFELTERLKVSPNMQEWRASIKFTNKSIHLISAFLCHPGSGCCHVNTLFSREHSHDNGPLESRSRTRYALRGRSGLVASRDHDSSHCGDSAPTVLPHRPRPSVRPLTIGLALALPYRVKFLRQYDSIGF